MSSKKYSKYDNELDNNLLYINNNNDDDNNDYKIFGIIENVFAVIACIGDLIWDFVEDLLS